MVDIIIKPKISKQIDQFRYIKIQHEALGNKPHKLCSYSPEPRTEIFCFRLNFNISKLVYLRTQRQESLNVTTANIELRNS